MSRVVPLSLGVIGLLIFLTGAVLLVSTMHGLNPDDEIAALTPVASIPLEEVAQQPLTTVTAVTPNTAQWKRIRRAWGEPAFVVSAVSTARHFAYCIGDLELGVEVNEDGHSLPLEFSGPAYDYSSDCTRSSVQFRAAPGAEIRVAVSRSGQRPMPSGRLIVEAYSVYTKDKIVGDLLAKDIRLPAVIASISGLALVAFAAYLQRRRAWQSR